jgi:hypothetical protein
VISPNFHSIVLMFATSLVSASAFGQAVECTWTPPPGDPYPAHVNVSGTVTIANLSDDNGDGETNSLDIPDLVFPSTSAPQDRTSPAVIRIVDGRCNENGTMSTLFSLKDVSATEQIDSTSAIAIGNLDPATAPSERAPELVLSVQGGKIAALERISSNATQWSVRLISAQVVDQGVGVQPSIADLDADGSPEIIAGRAVFNGQTGELIFSSTGGQGSDGFGAISTVVDWDLNGEQEVVDGQTIVDISGSQLIAFPIADGYTAIGNFNDDAFPELVHVTDGVVRVLDFVGTELLNVSVPGGGRGGPPTIADFDGDSEPEIGVVAQFSISMLDFECLAIPLPAECASEGIRWSIPIQEFTSGGQSSAAFDLNSDGQAEIFFLDEGYVRILGGSDGQVLFEHAFPSMVTWFQYPTLADIDSDGRSELVIPYAVASGAPQTGGVQIWSSPEWKPARGTWNQYSYHVTNINDEGQIPAIPEYNWQNSNLNSFRANSVVKPKLIFLDGFE